MEKLNQSPPIVAITPSNSTVYNPPLMGIRVGTTAGDVTVRSNGVDVTIVAVQVGETVPGSFSIVYSTGTTAAGINGWAWNDLV